MSSKTSRIGLADVDEKVTFEAHTAISPIPSTDIYRLPCFKRWNARIEGLAGFEARGLARVHESERHPAYQHEPATDAFVMVQRQPHDQQPHCDFDRTTPL
jgi:hypothetical protein